MPWVGSAASTAKGTRRSMPPSRTLCSTTCCASPPNRSSCPPRHRSRHPTACPLPPSSCARSAHRPATPPVTMRPPAGPQPRPASDLPALARPPGLGPPQLPPQTCCSQLGALHALGPNRPASRSCMFAKSGNGTTWEFVVTPRPRWPLAHSCASYDRDAVSRSRQTSISCTRVLHQRTRAPPPSLDWGALLHPRRRAFRLLPLRPSPTHSRRWRSPTPAPRGSRAPMPKRVFSKLALSTAPPSSQARFVAGGSPQHWNQRSPPSAC